MGTFPMGEKEAPEVVAGGGFVAIGDDRAESRLRKRPLFSCGVVLLFPQVIGTAAPYAISGSLPLVRWLQDQGYDVQICGYGLSSRCECHSYVLERFTLV